MSAELTTNEPKSEGAFIVSSGTGVLKCFLHDFETLDVNAWNKHCHETGHTLEGSTGCIDCKKGIDFKGIPYHDITPEGLNLKLRCPNCFTKYHKMHMDMQSKVISNNQQQELSSGIEEVEETQ